MVIRRLALAALFVSACKAPEPPTAFGVNLTVDPGALSEGERSSITQLHLRVAGETQPYERTVDVAGVISGSEVRIRYLPGVTSGVLSFACDGVDSALKVIASGDSGAVTLSPDGATAANIVLRVGTGLDLGVDAAADMVTVVPKKQGATCVAGQDVCESAGGCVDGYCCDVACATEMCKACNVAGQEGHCSALGLGAGSAPGHPACATDPASSCKKDGKCDGAGACRQHPLGTVCASSACNSTTNLFTPPSTCDGAGTCTTPSAITCAPFLCKDALVCYDTCSSAAQCTVGQACDGIGSCGKKANGSTCSAAAQCLSNSCVENVCCDNDCAQTCKSCKLAATLGTCSVVTVAGQDPRAQCPAGSGTNAVCTPGGCTGTTAACRKAAGGTACAQAVCTSATNQLTPSSACDTNGACATPANTSCGPFVCKDLMSCYAACTNDSHCTAGTVCDLGGSCKKDVNVACGASTECASGNCGSGFCVAASGPPFWLSGTNIGTARNFAGAATAADGRIFVIGGENSSLAGNSIQTLVDAYSPTSDSWSSITPLSVPTANMAAVLGGDNRIYRLGGYTNSGSLMTCEAYSSATNWTAIAPLPVTRTGGGALGSDGRLYVVGGQVSVSPFYATRVDAYTIGTNSWAAAPSLATGQDALGVTAGLDGRIYAVGGRDTDCGVYLKTMESYRPGDASWTVLAPMPTSRAFLSAATGSDGRIYAMGGGQCDPNTGNVTKYTVVEAYSPATDKWTPVPSLAIARSGIAAATGGDGRIYAISGRTNGPGNVPAGYSQAVEGYGPKVSLAPASGSAGTMAAISGGNFGANARVSVYFGASATPSATGSSNASGALVAPISFTVPSTGAAPYKVRIVDSSSRYPVFATFTVN